MTDWICPDGHPKYRVGDTLTCPTCEQIATQGQKPDLCKRRGHSVPLGFDVCNVCVRYKKIPWTEQLDNHGSATCSNGHEVTHDELVYLVRGGKTHERRCPGCARDASLAAVQAHKAKTAARHAAGWTKKRPPKLKDTLAPDYLDWVVAYRLAMGKVDEVYEMKRGDHEGATAMEKWVAYCSTEGRDPDEFLRTMQSRTATIRWQWAEHARMKGWAPKTLTQAMAE